MNKTKITNKNPEINERNGPKMNEGPDRNGRPALGVGLHLENVKGATRDYYIGFV